ncbi:hypothetical protein ACKOUP_14950, partial [Legionella pneumophila]
MVHTLSKAYASKEDVKGFLKHRVTDKGIVGDDPVAFWRGAHILRLQEAGNSQRDMLALFDKALEEVCGFGLGGCGKNPHTYVYMDDAVFSGGRVKSDLIRWIKEDAPKQAKVAVIVMAIHSLGEFFANKDIAEAAKSAGKTITVEW